MAYDPANLTSTPAGYATPEQLASVQEYVKQLTQGGQRDKTITSPWQGARMMADALSGNIMRNRLGQQEMAARAYSDPASLTGPNQGPAGPQISIPQQSSEDTSVAPSQGATSQTGGYGGLPSQAVDAIRKQEGYAPRAQWDVHQYSYGYGSKAPGPGAVATRSQSEELLNRDLSQAAALVDQVNPRLDPGTRAALTDLTFNTGIGWSRQGLGQAVRAGDLPSIKQGLLQYQNVAGRPNPVIANRRQMDAGWIGQPGAQVAQAGPAPGAGAPPPNAPAAMSGALAQQTAAGGGRGPLGQPGPQGTPTGNRPVGNAPPGVPEIGAGGPPNPSLYMGRPYISPQDFHKAMISPWIPEERKKALMEIYLNQGQPLQFQTPTGTYTRSPTTGAEGFTPGILQGDVTSGGTSFKGPLLQGTPSGGVQQLPGLQGAIGGGTPTVQQGSSNLIEVPGPSLEPPKVGGAPPTTPGVTPGPQGAAAPIVPGGKYASLTPQDMQRGGVGAGPTKATPVAAPAPGMLGTPPPVPSGTPPAGTSAPAPTSGKPTQVAQNMPPAGVGGVGGVLGGLQQMDLEQDRRKKFIENDQKNYAETAKAINDSGRESTGLLPTFDLASAALKKAYTGWGSDYVQDFNKLKAALGGDSASASALDIFDKAISESLTNMMRAKLQGLGQVRNKEIELMQKAAAGRYNTRQANEVVLAVAKAEAQQMQGLQDVAQRYGQGQRYMNGKWYQTQETPTGNGLQEYLEKYMVAHPTMDEKTIDGYMATLEAGRNEPPRRVRGQPAQSKQPTWQEGSPNPPPGSTVR